MALWRTRAIEGLVEGDLEEIILTVSSYRSDARQRVLDLYDELVGIINEQPEAFTEKYKNVRRGYLKKTFYAVYYLIQKNEVVILAVLDGRREPSELEKILRSRRRADKRQFRNR